jgi:hypothetical protein
MARILGEWHSKSLTLRFREAVSSVEAEFAKFWGSGFLQLLRDMFATQTGPAAGLVALKFYADCRLMQRQYREARSCYQSLIANTPATHVNFLSQVHFCLAANDIVQSNLSARTIQSIQNSLLLSNSPTHSLTCALLDFWVKVRLSLDFSMTLRSVAYSENPARVFQLARPFFLQQIAWLSRPGKRVWMMEDVSDAFLEMGCREHSLRCLWEAFNLLRDKKWDLVAQQLLGRIVQSVATDSVNLSRLLGDVCAAHMLYHPELLAGFWALYDTDERFPCGFVGSKMVRCLSWGFPSAAPPEFAGDWFAACERLFGAFNRGSFFRYAESSHYDCAVGCEVNVDVRLATQLSDFPLEDIRLAFDNGRKFTSRASHIKKPVPHNSVVRIGFVPTDLGRIEIQGVIFKYFQKVNLFVPFRDHSTVFYAHPDLPSINVSIVRLERTIFVGETSLVVMKVRNGDHELRRLSLWICDDFPAVLIEPSIEFISGQATLNPLGPNEELLLKIAVHGTKAGVFTPLFFFSYWANDPPPRYAHISFKLTVCASPRIESSLEITCLDITCPAGYEAVGFRSANFDVAKHVTFCSGRRASIDMVTVAGSHPEVELPIWAQANTPFAFWFSHSGTNFVEFPLPLPNPGVSILFSRSRESQWVVKLRNVSGGFLNDMKLTIMPATATLSYLVSGRDLMAFDNIEPGGDRESVFGLLCFEETVSIQCLISCEQFTFLKDVVVSDSVQLFPFEFPLLVPSGPA